MKAPEPIRNRIIGTGEEAPDQLLANPRNWRSHPQRHQDLLGDVLEKVGWVQQVIVNQRTGHLVDGHLRVALALRRDEATIPVLYVDLDEDEEAAVLATLDPLAGLAEVDEEKLADLMRDLVKGMPDLRTQMLQLAKTMGVDLTGAPTVDQDEVPAPPKDPVTARGDVWILGDHRLLCGDSTDDADVVRLLAGDKADLVLTDPPYGVAYVGGTKDHLTIENDEISEEDLEKLVVAAFDLAQSHVQMWTQAMHDGSRIGDIVYDPFSGSGTSIVVAELIGRRCRAMELSPAYCDVTVTRWEKTTGRKAVLEHAA